MIYKILYIEDLEPDTIIRKFNSDLLSVEHFNPETLEGVLNEITEDIDALVLDFKLTENEHKQVKFNAPTIAQTIRTRNALMHKDIPIVLLSEEGKITDYYEDYTSSNLFDFSVSKGKFRDNGDKYSEMIHSFIKAYKKVKELEYKYYLILGLTEDDYNSLDYRIRDYLNHGNVKEDVYAIVRFINHELIQTTGVLINENILSARLGIKKSSADWENLKNQIVSCAYNGILSDIFPTWWMDKIEAWWKENSSLKIRRLTADERVNEIKRITGFEGLEVNELSPYAKSKKFWTSCIDTEVPIDYIDGLELSQKQLFPWQESNYISIHAGLDSSPSRVYVKPTGLKKLRIINSQIEQNG